MTGATPHKGKPNEGDTMTHSPTEQGSERERWIADALDWIEREGVYQASDGPVIRFPSTEAFRQLGAAYKDVRDRIEELEGALRNRDEALEWLKEQHGD